MSVVCRGAGLLLLVNQNVLFMQVMGLTSPADCLVFFKVFTMSNVLMRRGKYVGTKRYSR